MVEFVVWLELGLNSIALKNSDLNFFSRIEVVAVVHVTFWSSAMSCLSINRKLFLMKSMFTDVVASSTSLYI